MLSPQFDSESPQTTSKLFMGFGYRLPFVTASIDLCNDNMMTSIGPFPASSSLEEVPVGRVSAHSSQRTVE
jgi:hypothetical protein